MKKYAFKSRFLFVKNQSIFNSFAVNFINCSSRFFHRGVLIKISAVDGQQKITIRRHRIVCDGEITNLNEVRKRDESGGKFILNGA